MSAVHRSNGEEEVDIKTRGTGTNVKTTSAVTTHASYESAMSTGIGESVTERLARICPGGGICDVNLTPKGRHYKYTPLEAIPPQPKMLQGTVENRLCKALDVRIISTDRSTTFYYLKNLQPNDYRKISLAEGAYLLQYNYTGNPRIVEKERTINAGHKTPSEIANEEVDFRIYF